MLSDILQKYHYLISEHLYIGNAKWNALVDTLKKYEANGEKNKLEDEQIWTFLVGCGYAAAGVEGVSLLSQILTGKAESSESNKIWFEVLPIPPREYEGNTNLDLAVGNITDRGDTRSGIQLLEEEDTWICFCEMKWNSDISTTVSYDLHRNQLIRVIENALCFQDKQGRYAKEVFVSLVTPAMFYNNEYKSRLYQYKYFEYKDAVDNILKDLHACNLKKRHNENWFYPEDINEQVNCLTLNWITYEHLFEKLF